jgi:hypothetical protein
MGAFDRDKALAEAEGVIAGGLAQVRAMWLAPLIDRLTAGETRLTNLEQWRNEARFAHRFSDVESKIEALAKDVAQGLKVADERVASLDKRLSEFESRRRKDQTDIENRLEYIPQGTHELIKSHLAPLLERLDGLERQSGQLVSACASAVFDKIGGRLDGFEARFAQIGTRVAEVERRVPKDYFEAWSARIESLVAGLAKVEERVGERVAELERRVVRLCESLERHEQTEAEAHDTSEERSLRAQIKATVENRAGVETPKADAALERLAEESARDAVPVPQDWDRTLEALDSLGPLNQMDRYYAAMAIRLLRGERDKRRDEATKALRERDEARALAESAMSMRNMALAARDAAEAKLVAKVQREETYEPQDFDEIEAKLLGSAPLSPDERDAAACAINTLRAQRDIANAGLDAKHATLVEVADKLASWRAEAQSCLRQRDEAWAQRDEARRVAEEDGRKALRATCELIGTFEDVVRAAYDMLEISVENPTTWIAEFAALRTALSGVPRPAPKKATT